MTAKKRNSGDETRLFSLIFFIQQLCDSGAFIFSAISNIDLGMTNIMVFLKIATDCNFFFEKCCFYLLDDSGQGYNYI